jgi:hypothetical protein
MRMRQTCLVSLLLPCVLASGVCAADPVVTLTWSFTEVYAGTNTPVASPNGVIEPGEAARIELTVSFSPAVGTLVQLTWTEGTVAGLAHTGCDLVGTNMAEGSWGHISRLGAWVFGPGGFPTPDGAAVESISVGQFPLPGTTANPQNPVEAIWSGVWTPDVYVPRTTIFASMMTSPPPFVSVSSLYLQIGTDPGGYPIYTTTGSITQTVFGSVNISVVPSPGMGVLAVGAAMMSRRKRMQPTGT